MTLRNLVIRLRGALDRARIRIGSRLMVMGADIASALIGLGLAIAPELRVSKLNARTSPWGAVVLIILLLLGAFTIGEGGMRLVERALPQREQQP